jgi:arylsulfatase A-like enzyme
MEVQDGGSNLILIDMLIVERTTSQPGHVVDIMPTLLDIIGMKYPKRFNGRNTEPLHGKSLLPVLQGKKREIPDFFISGSKEKFRMFRKRDWKIVKVKLMEKNGSCIIWPMTIQN